MRHTQQRPLGAKWQGWGGMDTQEEGGNPLQSSRSLVVETSPMEVCAGESGGEKTLAATTLNCLQPKECTAEN